MAFHHLLHLSRRVRLGGWKLGPWAVGGGWYTVEPTSVLRFVQFLDACRALGEQPSLGAMVERVTPDVLRPLLPLWVTEPIAPRHLQRATVGQIAAVWTAVGVVQDLDYMIAAMVPKPGAPESERCALDVLLVTTARELHLGDVDVVLRWPMQKMLAVLDALRASDQPAVGTPATPDEVAAARASFEARGWGVS